VKQARLNEIEIIAIENTRKKKEKSHSVGEIYKTCLGIAVMRPSTKKGSESNRLDDF
jgi:hypothetical protein